MPTSTASIPALTEQSLADAEICARIDREEAAREAAERPGVLDRLVAAIENLVAMIDAPRPEPSAGTADLVPLGSVPGTVITTFAVARRR